MTELSKEYVQELENDIYELENELVEWEEAYICQQEVIERKIAENRKLKDALAEAHGDHEGHEGHEAHEEHETVVENRKLKDALAEAHETITKLAAENIDLHERLMSCYEYLGMIENG